MTRDRRVDCGGPERARQTEEREAGREGVAETALREEREPCPAGRKSLSRRAGVDAPRRAAPRRACSKIEREFCDRERAGAKGEDEREGRRKRDERVTDGGL